MQDNYLEYVNLMLDHLEGFENDIDLQTNHVPDVLFSFLTSKDNNLVGVTLILINSVISSVSVNNNLLMAAGLISYEKIKMKKLLNFILDEKGKNMSYNEETVEVLLKLLGYDEPLRVFHFRQACKVLVTLAYRSDKLQCLTDIHQNLLNKAFNQRIQSLLSFLTENSDYDVFLEIFEEE